MASAAPTTQSRQPADRIEVTPREHRSTLRTTVSGTHVFQQNQHQEPIAHRESCLQSPQQARARQGLRPARRRMGRKSQRRQGRAQALSLARTPPRTAPRPQDPRHAQKRKPPGLATRGGGTNKVPVGGSPRRTMRAEPGGVGRSPGPRVNAAAGATRARRRSRAPARSSARGCSRQTRRKCWRPRTR